MTIHYYDLDGAPAKWDDEEGWPVMVAPNGVETRVENFAKFFHEASEIGAEEFDALLTDRGDAAPRAGKEPTHMAHPEDIRDPAKREAFKQSLVDRIVEGLERHRSGS